MRILGCAVLVLVCAGCLGARTTNEADLPRDTSIALPAGGWRMLRPHLEDGNFDLDLDGMYAADAYEAGAEDSFACQAMAASQGWAAGETYRHIGASYAGSAGPAGRSWSSFAYASIDGQLSATLGGSAADPWVLAAFDVFGPNLAANLNISSADPIEIQSGGRFWCLDGPARFTTGAYTVSSSHLDATGLGWSESMANGFLVRLQSNAGPGVLQAHVDGPSGRHALPAEAFANGGLDATFCSSLPGQWTLTIDRAGALVGVWKLTAFVFDLSVAWACHAGWAPSDLDLTGDS